MMHDSTDQTLARCPDCQIKTVPNTGDLTHIDKMCENCKGIAFPESDNEDTPDWYPCNWQYTPLPEKFGNEMVWQEGEGCNRDEFWVRRFEDGCDYVKVEFKGNVPYIVDYFPTTEEMERWYA